MKILALLILVFANINCLYIFNASGETARITVNIEGDSQSRDLDLPNNTHIHYHPKWGNKTHFIVNKSSLHPNFNYKLIKANGKIEASEMD